MLVITLSHDGIFIMLLLCCFGFLLYNHFVLAIKYNTIQPTFSFIFIFSKICFQLIQTSKGQHWATQSLVILDYLEIGRLSVGDSVENFRSVYTYCTINIETTNDYFLTVEWF